MRVSVPYLETLPYSAVLDNLVGVLPERAAATEALRAYRDAAPMVRPDAQEQPVLRVPALQPQVVPAWARSFSELRAWLAEGHCNNDDFFADFPFRQRGSCEEATLAVALQVDLQQTLRTFRSTATLDTHLTPEQAGEIFRLGQYLTLLSWPLIEARLGMPRNALPTGNVHPLPPAPAPERR